MEPNLSLTDGQPYYHRGAFLLPMNIRFLPILRDGKPEVLDLEIERRLTRAQRGEPLNDHPSPIPHPWEDRK